MSEMVPLMKPLRADSLLRRPAPVAARPDVVPTRLRVLPVSEPVLMRPAVFATPVPRAVPAEPEVPEAVEAAIADDDDDLLSPDAMPTEKMPVPVCVPLYEAPPASRPCRWPWLLLLAAALLAAGYYVGLHWWPLA